MRRRTALWLLAALLGLLIVAATTWATSQLTSQHIGISSEPLSAGTRLAPTVSREQAPPQQRSQPARTVTVRTVTVPTPPPASGGGGQSAPSTPAQPAPTTTVEREAAPTPKTGSGHDESQSGGTDAGGQRSGGRGGRERDD